jgi:NAD(P)-dependent dehydrogenase (short-subunit alcohol dehydrogenase family)
MNLEHRLVLLTGAKRIGAEIAAAVAAHGADVAIVYRRSAEEAASVVERVQRAGRRALAVQGDVSDPAAAPAILAEIERTFGRLDVLVNMASVYHQTNFDELDPAGWRRQLGVDLDGTFYLSRAAVPLLRKTGGGRIVNFCDWVAASGRPRYTGYVAYYVAKAGVKALTEALALELAPDGILVNAVAPGPILAPPDLSQADVAAAEQATPLGRWGGPGEIVKAVLALIDSDFMTGETIRVDGGRHLR